MEEAAEIQSGSQGWAPRTHWRVGGVRIQANRSKSWWSTHWNSLPEPMETYKLWPDSKGTSVKTKLESLNVSDSCIVVADWEPLTGRPGFNLYCLFWCFGTHSLWKKISLSLGIVGRALVLPLNNVLDFADSTWEDLPSLRRGWGIGWSMNGGVWKQQEEKREWKWIWHVKWETIVL